VLFQPAIPVIVKVVEEPARETTVVDILLGAIGLTGVLMLSAVLLGALLGGALIAYRIFRPGAVSSAAPASDRIRLDLAP
jgi:hypothetical protein